MTDKQQPTEQVIRQTTLTPEQQDMINRILASGERLTNEPFLPYELNPRMQALVQQGLLDPSGRTALLTPDQRQAMQGIMGLTAPEAYSDAQRLYEQAFNYTPQYLTAPTAYRPERYNMPGAIKGYGGSQYSPEDIATYGQSKYRPTALKTPKGPEQYGTSGYEAQQLGDYGASRYRPGTLAAPKTLKDYAGLTGVGAAGKFSKATMKEYMSPYMSAVTDAAARQACEENARQMMMSGALAAQQGGRGGSAEAVMRANLGRSLVQDIGDIYTKGRQSAFENAQQQYERDRAARLQYGQTNLAGAQQAYQLTMQARAQNANQQLAAFQANQAAQQAGEQARQNAYGLGLSAFQANDAAQRAEEQVRQQAYGLNLQAQNQGAAQQLAADRKSTRLNSSHVSESRMPSSA